MSESILEKSLDDIIGDKPEANRPRRRERGPRSGPRRERGGIKKPGKDNRRRGRGSSNGNHSNLPRDIVALAGSRPVLKVKNIHPDLNGEDLSNLFGTISPVDFVKFDNRDDSVAYVCFQRDHARSNREAISKYDGRKAMGETLIVENSVSLADRIMSNPVNVRKAERTDRAKPKPRERKPKPEKKDASALDAELEAYMNGGAQDEMKD